MTPSSEPVLPDPTDPEDPTRSSRPPRWAGWLQKLMRALPPRFGRLPFLSRVGLLWAAAFVVLFSCTALFAKLAAEMLEGETQALDEAVLHTINQYSSPQLDEVALEITALGDGSVLILMMLLASALLWTIPQRYAVVQLWIAVIGGTALTPLLKLAFQRPRPSVFEWRGDYVVSSLSFPSGHAMGSMLTYATLAYIITRLQPPPFLRRLTVGLAVVLIVLIGWSRMYLGVHYPSDVIAGYAVGLAWAILCAMGVEALRMRRTRTNNRPATP